MTLLDILRSLLNKITGTGLSQLLESAAIKAYSLGLATGAADTNMDTPPEPDIDAIASIGLRTQALSESTVARAKGDLAFNADKLYQEMDAAIKAGMSEQEALSQIEGRVKGLFDDSFQEWELERLVRDQVLVATKEGRRDGWQAGGAPFRQWKAHFDKKTADDSKRMDGQIAAIDEPYTDPKTGDKYMIPHIRPNDRCWEIPLFELPKYTTKDGLKYAK